MDYNELLIEILNMTPEQRKEKVRFASTTTWASDKYKNVSHVHHSMYDGPFLIED